MNAAEKIASALRRKNGIFLLQPCDENETKQFVEMQKNGTPIPMGIRQDQYGRFFREVEMNLSDDKMNELVELKQLDHLRSMRKSLTFFVVLTVIDLVSTFIAALIILSKLF